MAGSSHQKARLEPAVGDDVVDRCAGRNRSSPAAGRRYVSRYFKKHLFMRALRNALQSSHRFFFFCLRHRPLNRRLGRRHWPVGAFTFLVGPLFVREFPASVRSAYGCDEGQPLPFNAIGFDLAE